MSDEKTEKDQWLEGEEPVKEEVEETQPTEEVPKKRGAIKDAPGMYKGYDIKWLKSIGSDHSDFSLVAEYEEQYGEIN